MKSRLLLIVLATLVYYCSSTGTISYSTSSWVNYLNNASYKWWRYYTYDTYGYYCPSSDSTTYWGGSSSVRCSTESSYLPNNSKKLLCPKDSTYCNSAVFINNKIIFVYLNILLKWILNRIRIVKAYLLSHSVSQVISPLLHRKLIIFFKTLN